MSGRYVEIAGESTDAARLPVLHDPQVGGVEAGLLPDAAHAGRWFVHRLVGELERAPMSGDDNQASSRLGGHQVGGGFRAIFRVHVNSAHEPPRLVCSNWEYCHVEGSAPTADGPEFRMKPGVSRKQEGTSAGSEGPAAPQSGVSTPQASAREMLRGNAREVDVSRDCLLPPIALGDIARAVLLQKWTDPQRREPGDGGEPRCDALDVAAGPTNFGVMLRGSRAASARAAPR